MESTTYIYKTPIYQRRAYQNYIDKQKDNEEFKEARRAAARKYYKANREKVLEKMKIKRQNDSLIKN